MNKKDIGKLGEDFAAAILIRHGYEILQRNYRTRHGEVDIICRKDDIIAFVEVKARKKNSMVTGAEAVNYKKQIKIIKTADNYLNISKCDLQPRYDIFEIVMGKNITQNDIIIESYTYYENAFDTTGVL